MVEVFKTDVKCPFLAQQIIAELLAKFIEIEVSFDLTDMDCVLRLVCEKPIPTLAKKVKEIFERNGCKATLLTDHTAGETTFLFVPAGAELSIAFVLGIF